MRHVSTKQAARAVLYKNSTFYCSFITGIDLKKKKRWKAIKLKNCQISLCPRASTSNNDLIMLTNFLLKSQVI